MPIIQEATDARPADSRRMARLLTVSCVLVLVVFATSRVWWDPTDGLHVWGSRVRWETLPRKGGTGHYRFWSNG